MITLFIGGASSGKSSVAERFAATLPPPVTYVATWPSVTDDPAMAARVAAHRGRRPPAWGLVEVGADLAGALRGLSGTILVDALGTWVAGAPGLTVDIHGLCAALQEREEDTVVVSDEVGLGVHPSTAVGRCFREALGPVNEAFAAVADNVWLVVAGRVLPLARPAWVDR